MKQFFSKERVLYFIYLLAAIIGIWFLTKLWIPDGFVIAGHDSGLAINASDFFKSRFFAWDLQGFGRDNSGYFGSLVMHFVDLTSSKIAGVLYAGNQINMFFWISAVFISAAIFTYTLNNRLGKYFNYLFPVFITFNFYILQSLFIIERAKYSILVATLLFLAIYIKMRDVKISVLNAGVLISLVFLFFNGGSWLGLPLYGGLLVLGFSILIFELTMALKQKKWGNLVKLFAFYTVIGLGFIAFNAYSILPYSTKFFGQDYSAVTNQKVISANKGWLDNLSQASSYLNLFRLQGVPDWYVGEMSANPDHPYANLYLSNHLLVVFSYAFPLLSFLSFIFAKSKEQKELILLFGIALFLGVFFTAGSHSPLGFIYTLFYEHIPGFSIFRSPYYKFGSALFIAASVLIAFSTSYLIESLTNKLKNKYSCGFILTMVAICLWVAFYNVLLKPEDIFTWHPELSTRMSIPAYVNDFSIWFDKQETGESRTLVAPPLNYSWQNDAYNWGYWSLTNLPSVLSVKPFVSNGELDQGEKIWVDKLYKVLAEGDEKETFNLSKKLGIDYILLRNDALADSSWSAAPSPSLYADKFNSFESVEKIAVFGQWTVYKFKRDLSPLFYAANGVVSIDGNYPYLSQTFYSDKNTVTGVNVASYSEYLSQIVNEYLCRSCPLEGREALTSLPPVNILPNSPFYIFKQRTEDRALNAASTDRSKVDAYLGSVLRRGSEIKAMWNFGLDTDYAVNSLQKMNEYLKKTNDIYIHGGMDRYFEAKRLVDNLNVVEQSLGSIVSNYTFGGKKQDYRQGVFDVLWNIGKLKRTFPIIEDKNKLEMEKVYSVLPSGEVKRDLFIDENTMPLDLNNQPILPLKITFTSDIGTSNIKTAKTDNSLIKLLMPENYGEGKILMEFPRFPNLFVRTGFSTEQTPTGSRACVVGLLAKFNPNRKYRIEVTATKPWQVLKLFLKDGEINNGDSGFIQGQDEAEILPTLLSRPFYHIYTPSSGAKSLKIYLCNSNMTPPEFENLEFHEIVSPDIVAVDELPEVSRDYPKIEYSKIDPTHYRISVENATSPFVLVFNQSFNSSWQLDLQNSGHFTINGYANAWKISKTGTYTLDLLYTPQSNFKKGVIISLISVLFALGLSIASTLYNRRKNK